MGILVSICICLFFFPFLSLFQIKLGNVDCIQIRKNPPAVKDREAEDMMARYGTLNVTFLSVLMWQSPQK